MDFAPHVKSSVDIVRVIGDYVRLKKQGANRYVGLCPFHSEKTPSFSVHAALQITKCTRSRSGFSAGNWKRRAGSLRASIWLHAGCRRKRSKSLESALRRGAAA